MSSVSACGGSSASMLQSLHSSRGAEKAQQLFAKLDVNGDGGVDSSELKSLTDYLSDKTGTSVDADSLLKAIDTDGDGSVSSTELTDNVQSFFDTLRAQLSGSSSSSAAAAPDAEKLFASLDTDGDGKISLDEFKAGKPEGHRGPPPGGPPPGGQSGDDSGYSLKSLLDQYLAQSTSSSTSSLVSAAA